MSALTDSPGPKAGAQYVIVAAGSLLEIGRKTPVLDSLE